MPQLVIFDLDDTLCDYHSSFYRAQERIDIILNNESIDKKQFWEMFQNIEAQLQNSVIGGFLSNTDYNKKRFAAVCRQFITSVGVLPDVFSSIFHDEVVTKAKLFDDVIPVLTILKQKNIKIALATNGDVHTQRAKFRQLKLSNFIDINNFFISENLGVCKTSPKYFEHILFTKGVTAKQVVVVGDSLNEDIYNANKANIDAILLSRNETDLSFTGRQIKSLHELIEMLTDYSNEDSTIASDFINATHRAWPVDSNHFVL